MGMTDLTYRERMNKMDTMEHKTDGPKEAARRLARLMEKQLGYEEGHIDQIALRLFIRAYWDRVSHFAHIIHNETD